MKKKSVLLVDDEDIVLATIGRDLSFDNYNIKTASSGEEALERIDEENFDLVISDFMMPGINGLQLLKKVKTRNPDIVFFILTGYGDSVSTLEILENGADEMLLKPCDTDELLVRMNRFLKIQESMRRLKEFDEVIPLCSVCRIEMVEVHDPEKEDLKAVVEEKKKELSRAEFKGRRSRHEMLCRLAKAAEFRDNETARHTLRMSHYCKMLAEKAGLPDKQCERIQVASQLHDVGKIGMPDNILLKPGKLTTDEFEIIKKHSEIGYMILDGSTSEVLQVAASIAWTHHEKFDGKGYPRGLVGEDTPIEGRITAICDVFDALTMERAYNSAISVDDALGILREGRGSDFDPELIDMFIESIDEVMMIKVKFADEQDD